MDRLGAPKEAHGVAREYGCVIELTDIVAGALMLLTVALLAVMIWAGTHQH
jgi:hypothetical protein